MKTLRAILLTALVSLMLQLFLPWWSIVIAAALVAISFSQSTFRSFIAGFFGTAIVWWGYASMIDVKTQSVLSSKIAELFHAGSPVILILISGLIAGVVGGLAAMSGNELKKMF